MDAIGQIYVDAAGPIFLAVFVAATLALAWWASSCLSPWWWLGALASGLVVGGVALMIAIALQGLDSGPSDGITVDGWLAIGAAGALGFFAGTDVQLATGGIRGTRGGGWSVVAGAVAGPMVVIGGYFLLVRSTEWVRGIG